MYLIYVLVLVFLQINYIAIQINLVHIVGPKILKKDTNFRIAVPVEERILITLQ